MFKDIQTVLVNPVTLPLVAIALLCIAVFWTLVALRPDLAPKLHRFSQNPWMNAIGWLSVILALPVILIVGSLFNALVDAGNINDPAAQSTVIRNYGLVLAAMIGVPFVIWRSIIAQKQVDVAEQGQITDRISKAVEGLGAEKTVKEGKEEKTAPNLEVRVGAIYALERIAQDSDRDHIQIMEILCAYIRENAPAENAEPVTSKSSQEQGTDEVDAWARQLEGPRTDVRVALEVIGRRSKNQIALERAADVRGSKVGYRLDLRHTCLQGADLSELDFEHALLNEAQMQGAFLRRTQMQGADLRAAQMQGATLLEAQMQGAILLEAQMQGADVSGAQMQGANFRAAQMQGADLREAQMDENTDFSAANLRGAALRKGNYKNVALSQKQVRELFYDGSVKLPDEFTDPDLQRNVLAPENFYTQWRAWQKKIGYDPSEDTP